MSYTTVGAGVGQVPGQPQCPPGEFGVPPLCFPLQPGQPTTTAPPTTTGAPCPPGSVGIQPLCVPIGTQPPPGPVIEIEPPTEQPVVVPVPPCPATTPTMSGGVTEWVEHKGRCQPKYLYECPAAFPSLNVQTGLCTNPDNPSAGAVPPNKSHNPTLGWWSRQTDATKGLIIGGGALTVIGLGALLLRGPAPQAAGFTPNLKRSARGVPVVKGKIYGHATAPKKYARATRRRRSVAIRPADYADPERFTYPLVFRKPRSGRVDWDDTYTHLNNAKSRFSQYKQSYPTDLRATISGNINRTARWFNSHKPKSFPYDVKPDARA